MTERGVEAAGVGVGAADASVDSWEARAVELFTLCDRESKGFVTKRDLQRLWGELPLEPDELERVFDSLDQDHNGFLSLQEFTDGFGSHLGLVVQFRADSTSSSGSEGEQEDCHNVDDKDGVISTHQLDTILNSIANQDLDSNSAVVEAVWQEVCSKEEGTLEHAKLERLVAALLQELSRVRLEHANLEAALTTKTDQYNQQVSHLYEELEMQISGEMTKAAREHSERGSQALTMLEEEVAEREAALHALEEEQQALSEQLKQAVASEMATKQDNVYLSQQVDRLEEELTKREVEVLELTATLEALKKNNKDEKRRRAQQAFKVSEGIARERESLATQLDLLRTINTQLRDEHDQAAPYHCWSKDSGGGSSPVTILGTPNSDSGCQTTTTLVEDSTGTKMMSAVQQHPPLNLDLTSKSTKQSPAPCFDLNDKLQWIPGNIQTSDCEHDDEYFTQSVDVKFDHGPVFPHPNAPVEKNLLEELLQHAPLCIACEGTLPDSLGDNPELSSASSRILRQDSMTQTSPIELMPSAVEAPDLSEVFQQESSRASFMHDVSPADVEPMQLSSVGEVTGSCTEVSTNPALGHLWQCSRLSGQPPATQQHSTTVIIYQPGHHTTIELLPLHHTHHTHHTRHTYHTYHTYGQQTQDILSNCNKSIISTSTENQRGLPDASKNSQAEGRNDEFVTSCYPSHESVDLEIDTKDQVTQSAQNFAQGDVVKDHHTRGDIHDDKDQSIQDDDVAVTLDRLCTQTVLSAPVDQSEEDATFEEDKCLKPSPKTTVKVGSVSHTGSEEHIKDKISDTKETRQSVQRNHAKNTPTLVVTPLLHSYPHGEDKSKVEDNKSNEFGNRHERQEGQMVTATLEDESLLYCPSRMFKVVFIGDSGVGKTSFIYRASTGEFQGNFGSTVGVDYQTMEVQVGDVLAVLHLWDTAGQERFRSITKQYYRKADGVVVMYDLTNEQSFLNVMDWITSVKETAGEDVMVMVLGNKEDLLADRHVDQSAAYRLAKANNCFMCECSAATGGGVQEAILHIATVLTTRQEHNIATTAITLQEPLKKRICC